jgi:RNA polymerase sigma-70 factor, ECF subfamily
MALIDRLRGVPSAPSAEEVVRQHSGDVHRLLRRMFGPGADVEDLFQAVFVEVLRSLPTFRGKSKLRTWIHRITLNVAYQEMRMQYRERAVRAHTDIEQFTCEADVERKLVEEESLRMLYVGLETLEPKKRMAIVLHDLEEHTLKEIGELLGRPLQTVASQLKAGRLELSAYFAKQEREEAARAIEVGGRS